MLATANTEISGEVLEKRTVFKEDLEELTEDAGRLEAGNWFHVVGAWYEKQC